MPLSFPSNPSVNQTSTQNGRVYRWTGAAWEFASTSVSDDARWSLFVPPAPTNLTATAGNAQVALSWTAPTVLAQTPITDYVVQFSSNSGSTWTTFSDGTSTATSATVTGLTNGTAYVFRVAAVNGVGTGQPTAATSSVTPTSATVTLLLHFDSNFTDSSGAATAVNNSGVTISSSQSKFGGSSAYFASGTHLYFDNPAALTWGTDDFTLEMWVYFVFASSGQLWDGRAVDSLATAPVLTVFNNSLRWQPGGAGGITGPNVSANQWYHIAVSRASGTTRLFLDGVQGGGDFADTTNYANQAGGPVIGMYKPAQVALFNGFIDEVRVTKGLGRYTANFTPPAAAFPNP